MSLKENIEDPDIFNKAVNQVEANTKHLYPMWMCLTPDTMIQCEQDVKPIGNITCGTKVLTHKGRYNNVLRIYRRHHVGKIIKIKAIGSTEPLQLTPEHPVMIVRSHTSSFTSRHGTKSTIKDSDYQPPSNPYWIKASEVNAKTDYLVMPILTETKMIYNIDFLTLLRQDERHKYKIYGNDIITSRGRFKKQFPRFIKVNRKLIRLIGYYLAEGNLDKRRIGFTFNIYEVEYVNEVKKLMYEIFSVKCDKVIKSYSQAIQIRFSGSYLSDWFKQFGTRAKNRRIPNWLMILSPLMQRELIKTYWRGDGGSRTRERKTHMIKWKTHEYYIVTTSRLLSIQIRNIIARLKIATCLQIIESKTTLRIDRPGFMVTSRQFNIWLYGDNAQYFKSLVEGKYYKTPLNQLHSKGRIKINDNYLLFPIQTIQQITYDDDVCNIEVENDNSYVTATGFTLHNCNWAINLSNARYGESLDKIYKRPTPKKVLIVGAGPSLKQKKHLDTLLDNGYDGKIIASDGALPLLAEKGIKVDYSVTVDGSPIISKWFLKHSVPAIGEGFRAVLPVTVHPSVVNMCNRNGFKIAWYIPELDSGPDIKSVTEILQLQTVSEDNTTGLSRLNGAGNCGLAAIVFAATILRSPEIALIGMDSGYRLDTPLNELHYHDNILRSSGFNKEECAKLYRTYYMDMWKEYCVVDPVFEIYKKTFVNLANQMIPQKIRLINCTEGGCLAAEGVEYIKLIDYLK